MVWGQDYGDEVGLVLDYSGTEAQVRLVWADSFFFSNRIIRAKPVKCLGAGFINTQIYTG